jgi:hypothetical protein
VTHHAARVLYHDLFTNGIVYLDVGMNLHTLPADLLPYAGLFGSLLLEMGTEAEDFVKLTQRIGRTTGGISPTTLTATVRGTDGAAAWTFLRGKATVDRFGALLDILRDVLLTVRLDNKPRLMQMVLEKKAKEEAGLVPMGHRVVATRLRAKLDPGYWAAEQVGGLDYLLFLRRLIKEIEQDWPAVLAKLEQVRSLLVNREMMLCNVTVDGEAWVDVEPRLADFLASLPAQAVETVTWHRDDAAGPEALTLPAAVNYVGKGANLFDLGYRCHGSTEVITHYLRSTWLWERVRVQGGAYGGFSLFDPHGGAFAFVSYRDPNLLRTLDIYDQTAGFLRDLDLSHDELVKSMIGAIGTIDAYQLPDAKGYSAMSRYLINYSDVERQQYRTELLHTTVDDFRAFAEVLARVADAGDVVVLGSASSIETAADERGLDFTLTKVL